VWDKGEYTKYATAEHRRIGDNLRNTPTGREQFDKLVNHDKPISTVIDGESTRLSERGNLALGVAERIIETNTRSDKKNLLSATIKLYKKNIELAAEKERIGVDEQLASTAGHEIEHTTEENVQLSGRSRAEIEKQPEAVGDAIIREYRQQKPILNPDKNYHDVIPKIEEQKLFYGGGW
jgi:hypothetical protein